MAHIATGSGGGLAASMALAASITILTGCSRREVVPGSNPTQTSLAERSVCPQHGGGVWIPGKSDTAWRLVSNLTVPGTITTIPEFHDCQRLLKPGGEGYGPTAGVFANPLVVTLVDTLLRLEQTGVPDRAIAAAEIISDGDFQPLGIQLGVNCLYMYTVAGQLHAVMPSVSVESDCAQRLNPIPPQTAWTPLNVNQESEAGELTLADFPPAARWDYDEQPGPRMQFVGLPCRTAWCLIGHPNAHSWKRYHRPAMPPRGKLSRRVVQIRGWYDEQKLGVAPASGGPVTPSGVYANIFPDSLLDGRTAAYFELAPPNEWVDAAEILLHGNLPRYKTKFNLDPTAATTGEVPASNKLALCKGTAARCLPGGAVMIKPCTPDATDPWYARITSVGTEVKYTCVIRHKHPGFSIPGTARWWWLPTDEGIWTRCPQGCCQVT